MRPQLIVFPDEFSVVLGTDSVYGKMRFVAPGTRAYALYRYCDDSTHSMRTAFLIDGVMCSAFDDRLRRLFTGYWPPGMRDYDTL